MNVEREREKHEKGRPPFTANPLYDTYYYKNNIYLYRGWVYDISHFFLLDLCIIHMSE